MKINSVIQFLLNVVNRLKASLYGLLADHHPDKLVGMRFGYDSCTTYRNRMIKIADKKAFTKKILDGTGLHIVRFCTEWSGPCQMMGPIYQEIFRLYKKSASFYRIDIDKAPLLKKEFGITELPTILFYKNGKLIDFAAGLISRDALIVKMDKLVK